MQNNYLLQVITQEKEIIQELIVTESTRKSKVLQIINRTLAKKHNIELKDVLNYEVYKIKK